MSDILYFEHLYNDVYYVWLDDGREGTVRDCRHEEGFAEGNLNYERQN